LPRPFALKPEIRYDHDTHRLLSYHSASNPINTEHGVQNVTITYRYSIGSEPAFPRQRKECGQAVDSHTARWR
jgi:hypothetical protein